MTGKIRVDPRLYLASAADILEVLRGVRDTEPETVMIVGHNPGLEVARRAPHGRSSDNAHPLRSRGSPC